MTVQLAKELQDYSYEELKEAHRHIVLEQAKKDLIYLNQELLGHKDATREVFGELCDLLQKDTKDTLILLPRGTLKTSIVTEGFVIQQIIKNPNIRILLVLETREKATKYLKGIKDHLTSELFVELAGNLVDETCWREDEIRVKGRTSTEKEHTIMVGSLEKSITGFHFDLIIADDLHSEANTRTAAQIEMAKNVFAELTNVGIKGTRKIVLGTTWTEKDVYCTIARTVGITDWSQLLSDRLFSSKYWNIYLRQCVEPVKEGGETIVIDKFGTFEKSKLFYPKLDAGVLSEKYNSPAYTRYTFLCQFFCNPTATENSIFTKEELDWAKEKAKQGKPLFFKRYLLVDPAYTVKKKSDFTAFVVLGQTAKNEFHVLLAYKDKLEARDVVEKIFVIRDQLRTSVVAIEANATQQILSSWIKDKQREKGVHFRITEVKTGPVKSKEDRIKAIHGYFKNKQIAISEEFEDLLEELSKFPNTLHDDLIDALSFIEQVKRPVSNYNELPDPALAPKPLFLNTGY